MAKWGEGDPRWIVEERCDATNVNNWHWTEKNATGWSKDKLKALLEGFVIEDENHKCEIKEFTKLEGEASANNRKAKLIFFYEWDLKAEWKGIIRGCDSYHKGKLEIPNLSEENEPSDLDVSVSANTDKEEAYRLKEFMRTVGAEKIRDQLAKYIAELKTEFSQGMILPAKNAKQSSESTPKNTENKAKQEINKVVQANSNPVGVKIRCKKLTDKQNFKCRAADIYRALTEKDMVRAFTRGDVQVEAEKGGRFALFGGNVQGEFTELAPYQQIVMRWRYKSWPVEHYSTVTMEFKEKEDSTDLVLTQTGIPEAEYDRTVQGWQQHYWESIKQTFGFGARLF